MLPSVGQKKSEPTHYHMYQFAQNNTHPDVFQSLLPIQRSPIYHTFAFSSLTKTSLYALLLIRTPHFLGYHILQISSSVEKLISG